MASLLPGVIRVSSLIAHNSGRGGDKWLRRGRGESDGNAVKGLLLRGRAEVADSGEGIQCGACVVDGRRGDEVGVEIDESEELNDDLKIPQPVSGCAA